MLTITSDSIDELNAVYKQLKHSYEAQGNIQINTSSFMYEMTLEKISINPVVRNLSQKTYEWLLADFEGSNLTNLEEFFSILKGQGNIPFIRQLLEQLEGMHQSKQKQVLSYFRELRENAEDLNVI